MARRRPVPVAEPDGPPVELLEYPVTAEGISVWVPDTEPMPVAWDFGGLRWWRLITAHGRLSAARQAWCAKHGRSMREVFPFTLHTPDKD